MNDKYLNYELEEFLTDDAFVNWVLRGEGSQDWTNWLNKHPEQEKRITEVKNMVYSLQFKTEVIGDDIKSKVWRKIEKNTEAKTVTLNSKRRLLYGLASAAAIALLLILLLPQKANVYISDNQIAKTITLPADSEVIIEPSSKIKYRDNNWGQGRLVELQGFAHFTVSKGVPFKVDTQNGQVEVLGTEFDVVSAAKSFYVKVREGKVNVKSGNRDEILTANMAFYKNPIWVGDYKIDNSWKTDKIYFDFKDQLLSEVLKTIPFYFNINVDLSSIKANLKYTGAINTAEGLEVALQKILWPLNINYKMLDDKIILNQG